MDADLPTSRTGGQGEAQRLSLFVVASRIAAAANYCLRFGVSTWLVYPVAIVCAYLAGLTAAVFVVCRCATSLLQRLSQAGMPFDDPAASEIALRLSASSFAIVLGVLWLLPFARSGEAATARDSRAL
jgi:hypothetical protein